MSDIPNEVLDDVKYYKLILRGVLKRFPAHFWDKPYSLQSAKEITKYLIEDKLKISLEDIPKKVDKKFIQNNRLGGMLRRLFKNHVFEIVDNAYPNMFKRWQFKVPCVYWNSQTIEEAMRWLIDERLGGDIERVKKELDVQLLKDSGMSYLITMRYPRRYSIYDLVSMVYPNVIEPWELKHTSQAYWTDDNIKKQLSLIAHKEFNDSLYILQEYITNKLLNKYKLYTSTVISIERVHRLIKEMIEEEGREYCGKDTEIIREYALVIYKQILDGKRDRFPDYFWTTKHAKFCARVIIRYLTEKVLGLDLRDCNKDQINEILKKHKLYTVLTRLFNNSSEQVLQYVYES